MIPERFVVIEAPPRHGKSEFISRRLPAWYLGTHPEETVILTSYGASLARKWGRRTRDDLEQYGADLFGIRIAESHSAANDWSIAGHAGGMITAGVGGPITGHGGRLLIVDDYAKNAEEAGSKVYRDKVWEWWLSTAMTRMEPGAVAIIMATRWDADDLIGRILKASERGEFEPVRRVHLPAVAEADDELGRAIGEPLWPDRWPLDALEKIKRNNPGHWWSAMYQQRPAEQYQGAEWPSDYFDESIWFDDWPHPETITVKVVALDPSLGKTDKSDYQAFVELGVAIDGTLWIDADIERQDIAALTRKAFRIGQRFRPEGFGVESNGFQQLLAAEFRRHSSACGFMLPIFEITNSSKVGKANRIRRLTPYLSDRKIRVRRSPGGELLVEMLKAFPGHAHDDGPDALEMAVRLARSLWSGEIIEEPDELERVM